MRSQLLAGAVFVAVCTAGAPSHAQFGPIYGRAGNQQNNTRRQNGTRNPGRNQGQNQGQNQDGVLPLPEGIDAVISIDAQNTILAAVEDENNPGQIEYKAFPINHVYSGAIAKILGGTIVPTESFVAPDFNNNQVNGPGNGLPGNTYGNGQANPGYGAGTNPYGGNPYGGNPYGANPYGTGAPSGNPYLGSASGFNPGFANPGSSSRSGYQQGYPNAYTNQNFQVRPRHGLATRQLQQVIGWLDVTPRQVAIGP